WILVVLLVLSLTVLSGAQLPRTRVLPRVRLLRTVALAARPRALVVDERTHHVFVATAPSSAGGLGRVTTLSSATGAHLGDVPAATRGNVFMAVDARAGHVFVVNTPLNVRLPGVITMLDAATGRPLHTSATRISAVALTVDGRWGRLFISGTYGLAIL